MLSNGWTNLSKDIIGTVNRSGPYCPVRAGADGSSESSFQRVRADIGSVLQDLPGDLLDVGIVVLRRVWNGFRLELQNKPLSFVEMQKKQHFHQPGSCHRITLHYIQAIKKNARCENEKQLEGEGRVDWWYVGVWWGNSATHASLL